MPSVSKLNKVNLFQHLTASLSCSSPRTDPETSYSPLLIENIFNYIRYGQDDHLLWAIVICYIEEQKNKFLVLEQ